MTKVCNECYEEKPLSDFTPSKTGKQGVLAKCKPCKAAISKAYRDANPDRVKSTRQNAPSSKDRSKYDKKYREANKDRLNERRRKDSAYKKRQAEARRQDRINNPDKFKRYYQNSIEAHRASSARRRIRKASIPDTMPNNFMDILIERYGDACMNPNCPFEITEWNVLSHDHIIPVSHPDSSHSLENSQLLCRRCNSAKNDRIIDYR